ncbi:MAG: leucine-rich repeat domain-containing protein [Promethearchaeota archaeon]
MKSNLNPEIIYKQYENNELDKEVASKLLISIIENDRNEDNRVKSIEIIGRIGLKQHIIFELLENLLISDSNERVRSTTANVLFNNYQDKGIEVIKWALRHEQSPLCLEVFLKVIEKVNSTFLNHFLKMELSSMQKKNSKIINCFYDGLNLPNSTDWLIEIFLKCKILLFFGSNLWDFSIRDDEIVKIAISGLNVKKISDIIGLELLTKLEYLDLSGNNIMEIDLLEKFPKLQYLNLENNQIREIKGLSSLKNLVHVNLGYNKISKLQGLGRLVNLAYLNLEGNQIHELNGLETLINLQELNLINNKIKQAKKPESLKNLWIFEY